MKKIRYRMPLILMVCISSSLICVALTFWGNFKAGGVITIDAYIGVIATFISICTAIVVGFQLYSYFEFRSLKERIDNVEAIKREWNEDRKAFANEMHITKKGVSNAFRVIYRQNRKDTYAPIILVVSILTYDLNIVDDDASRYLKSRYLQLNRCLNVDNYDTRLLKRYLPDLKAMEIPKGLKDYDEICALHFKIITQLSKPVVKRRLTTGE